LKKLVEDHPVWGIVFRAHAYLIRMVEAAQILRKLELI
jgi:hypothetical protein